MTSSDLLRLSNWIDGQIAGDQESPSILFQYMKAREAVDAILAAYECFAIQTESEQLSFQQQFLRLVVSNTESDRIGCHQ